MAFVPFALICQLLLVLIDVVCNFLYPAHETLYYLKHHIRTSALFEDNQEKLSKAPNKGADKFTSWMTYWVFSSVLYFV
jgi:hypothetical protein